MTITTALFVAKVLSLQRVDHTTFVYMPLPSQYLDFQRYMSWSVLCSVSSVKMRGDCSFC
jgi:hypothetical protein